MTYLELRDLLDGMSPTELAHEVVVYSGDIDDTIRVIGTSPNTDEAMGESMEGFATTQPFLVLE